MALSFPGTLSPKPRDIWDPDPAGQLEEGPPCETLLDPEVDCSMDVILVGSSEPSAPPSPEPCRDLIAHEVKVNQRDIEDLCICCGSFQVHTQHPLFEGGMCAPCKDTFVDCLFLYDDDGYQSYCSICCSGETLLICENPDCTRCYCFECVDTLVGPGTSGKVQALSNWVCFLCLPFPSSGLLRRRAKWRGRLKAFYDQEVDSPLEMYKTVPVWKREPVRVLSLFGDIKAELASLGFLESGSGPGRLKHLDDVTNTVRKDVEQWGPFDLVYGATPPFSQACDRPPGWYLFQFHRVLQYARPGGPRPFFWMFVDNLVLTEDDRAVASRFLEVASWPPAEVVPAPAPALCFLGLRERPPAALHHRLSRAVLANACPQRPVAPGCVSHRLTGFRVHTGSCCCRHVDVGPAALLHDPAVSCCLRWILLELQAFEQIVRR
ncbi:DNA (cytosine-5)-methyltransferase 3-like isoform X1 [Pteropus alecto]|uniref:DNA (cytosine-5)-methyltransferase 3-like isoform X1 n=2 Tax=Pteropus alecto TaxID=9402 RepID=UPI0007688AD7|nr:DNA (cytosine-5)-methyltransferase 3-like isoform X1 [Pteropus alecto]